MSCHGGVGLSFKVDERKITSSERDGVMVIYLFMPSQQ